MANYVTIQGGLLEYDDAIGRLSDQAHRVLFVSWVREQRPVAGVRRFVPQDALKRLPRPWDEIMVVQALEELEAAGLAVWDREARLLFLRPALEHDRARGEKSVKGAVAALKDLPDSPALIPALDSMAREAELVGGDEMEALAGGLRLRIETLRCPIDGASPQGPTQEDAPSMGHPESSEKNTRGSSAEVFCPKISPIDGGPRARVSLPLSQASFPPKPPLSKPGGLWGRLGLGRKGGPDED